MSERTSGVPQVIFVTAVVVFAAARSRLLVVRVRVVQHHLKRVRVVQHHLGIEELRNLFRNQRCTRNKDALRRWQIQDDSLMNMAGYFGPYDASDDGMY